MLPVLLNIFFLLYNHPSQLLQLQLRCHHRSLVLDLALPTCRREVTRTVMIAGVANVLMRKERIRRVSEFSFFVPFCVLIYKIWSFGLHALGVRVKFVLLQR